MCRTFWSFRRGVRCEDGVRVGLQEGRNLARPLNIRKKTFCWE